MNEKVTNTMGWFASFMGLVMYFSFVDQIHRNLTGNKGSFILATASTIAALAWVLYGSLKHKRDWPLIICNIFGLVLSFIAAITSF